jgi:hypothetical protein
LKKPVSSGLIILHPFFYNIRQEDLKARDEFHQRMIKKDKDKQRNIVVKVKLGMHRISGRIIRPFLISGIRPDTGLPCRISGKAG